MGTTAYGGKGAEGRAANSDRPVGANTCRNFLLSPADTCRTCVCVCVCVSMCLYQTGRHLPTPAVAGVSAKYDGDRPTGAASCRREQHTKGDMPPPPPPIGLV